VDALGKALQLVLDTNVILDLVVFDDPGVRPLRAAIERAEVAVYSCEECLEELRRVLAYPKFKPSFDPAQAYARYAGWARVATLPAAPEAHLPRCSDPDDQKFLALAHAVRADRLLTRDRALLDLAARARKYGGFDICTPARIWDNRPRHGA